MIPSLAETRKGLTLLINSYVKLDPEMITIGQRFPNKKKNHDPFMTLNFINIKDILFRDATKKNISQ